MKKEIPVLFSTPMVQAIMQDRKTMTRRLSGLEKVNHKPDEYVLRSEDDITKDGSVLFQKTDFTTTPFKVYCPYGQPGDLLWVRESWRMVGWNMEEGEMTVEFTGGSRHTCFYPGSDEGDDTWIGNKIDIVVSKGCFVPDKKDDEQLVPTGKEIPWSPSIHMPKDASRIWLENTGVRPERLQDISEQDAIAEGIEWKIKFPEEHPDLKYWKDYQFKDRFAQGIMWGPKRSFRSLWQSINGKPSPIQKTVNGKLATVGYIVYPFDQGAANEFNGLTSWKKKPLTVIINPWVWVVQYKIISKTGKP